MFHTLHRIVVVAGWGLVMLACYATYRSIGSLGPLKDMAGALAAQQGRRQSIVEELDGPVVRVHTGDLLEVENGVGERYLIRLTGLNAPEYLPSDRTTERPAAESRDNLSRLTLSNQVHVDVTFVSTRNSGLGIVYVGETNVNAAQVGAGFATLAPELMNGLPVKVKFELLQASRERQEALHEASKQGGK